MGFGQSIATCFRKYLTISGRASRSEFWWFYLFTILAALVCGFVDSIAFNTTFEDTGPIEIIFWLATIVPTITATVRRLHVTNRPGYYIFAPILIGIFGLAFTYLAAGSTFFSLLAIAIIIFGVLLQLYWLVQKSDPHDNRYGPNPFMGERLDQVFE